MQTSSKPGGKAKGPPGKAKGKAAGAVAAPPGLPPAQAAPDLIGCDRIEVVTVGSNEL